MLRTGILFAILLSGHLQAGQDERQPAYLLEIPASVGTVLIAEADTGALHIFDSNAGTAAPGGRSYMSIGQNGVGKVRAWDRKTPLGIYFVTEEIDTSGLHRKYGPAAFALDYPNIWDRTHRRSGDGIWIHGVISDDSRRPPLDTDGCIALPNDELLAIGTRLVPLQTPVLVTRSIRWAMPENIAAERDEVRTAVDQWAKSYVSGDLHRHLSLYADEFTYRGMNRDEWVAFRTQSMTGALPARVEIDDRLLLADPEYDGLYLSRFRLAMVYEGRTIATLKRLYWQRTPDGELRIVAEDSG